jgi:deoxyribonucleoside regulator
MRTNTVKTPLADSDEHLALIARLYYVDGLAQNEVAKLANVSQAKVSRLLALAKERGIVRITVAEYDPRRRELEQQLKSRLGFKNVVVIKASEGSKSDDLRRAVGYFGAAAVDSWLTRGDVVALAGGRTIHELVRHLPTATAKSLTVVQAMGTVDSHVSLFDAQEVGRVMAQRFGGTFLSLNTPAFIPEKRTRDALLELQQVKNVRAQLSRATIAIIGVGTLANSVFVERGTLDTDMARELERAGAVGEICGRFIDASGNECATAWRDRVISVQIEQLRKTPEVIAVVSGSDRSAAILAAIKGRIIKSLLIDELGAAALLAAGSTTVRKPSKKKIKV